MPILPPTSRSLDLAVQALAAGGMVIHPTETCYGIACDLTNSAAVARLFALKRRPKDQPVSALFPSVAESRRYAIWNTTAKMLAQEFLPGPLTIILPLRNVAPHTIFLTPPNGQRTTGNGQRHVGIRVSSHPIAQKLVTLFGRPISTTSANISGKPPTYSVEEIVAQFRVLDGAQDIFILDAGPLSRHSPSTIMDVTGTSPREVRRGTIIPKNDGV